MKGLKDILIEKMNSIGDKAGQNFDKKAKLFFQYPHSVVIFVAFLVIYGLLGTILSLIFLPKSIVTTKPNFQVKSSQNVVWGTSVVSETTYAPILKRQIFDLSGAGNTENTNVVCSGPIQSQEPFQLRAIIYGGSSEGSVALIAAENNPVPQAFRLYEMLPGQFIIREIQQDRVLFSKESECLEYILLPPPPSPGRKKRGSGGGNSEQIYSEEGFERRGNNTKVTREWVDRILSTELTKTLQDAKATPYMEGGKIRGFALSRIKENSVYEKAGLKNGDVVQSINGTSLENASQAIQLLNSLRGSSNIKLSVMRDGKIENFTINIQ